MTMTADDSLRQRKANGVNGTSPDLLTITDVGKERDAALDKHDRSLVSLYLQPSLNNPRPVTNLAAHGESLLS